MIAQGTATVLTIGTPIVTLVLALALYASNKAPRVAGVLMFSSGVGLTGTAFATTTSNAVNQAVTGGIDAFASIWT